MNFTNDFISLYQNTLTLKTLNQIDKLCVKFGISLQQLLIAYLTQLENINQIILNFIH